MSDTSNLYNDMRNLIHFLPFICSGYPWRAIGNTLTVLQSWDILVPSPTLVINDAVNQKNIETFVSSFFAFRHRSKVIFRVTQKSLRILLTYFRKHLALRGGDHARAKFGVPWIYFLLQNPLPVVADFEVTLQPFRFSPDGCKTVGLSCASRHRRFQNLKCNGHGK